MSRGTGQARAVSHRRGQHDGDGACARCSTVVVLATCMHAYLSAQLALTLFKAKGAAWCCMHQQWRARCTLRVCSRRRRTTKRSLSVFLTTSICAEQFFWTDVHVMPRCDLSRTARLIERASLWAQRRRVHAFFRSVAGAPLYWYVFWRIQRLPLSPSWGWTATHAIGPPGKYELHII